MGVPVCGILILVLVDVHSHYWEYPEHFSEDFKRQAIRARGDTEVDLTVRWEDYNASAEGCEKTIVFGGKARLSGLWVPDNGRCGVCGDAAGKLIAFLSLDPTRPGWQDEMFEGHKDLNMKGIKLLPMYAGFYPNDRGSITCGSTRRSRVTGAAPHGHHVRRPGSARLYGAPSHRRCRRRYPDVKIIMAHL